MHGDQELRDVLMPAETGHSFDLSATNGVGAWITGTTENPSFVFMLHPQHLLSLLSLAILAHFACMSDDRHPVQVLFGQLSGPGVKGRRQETWRLCTET